MKKQIMAVGLLFSTLVAQAQTISTVAGTGVAGFSGDGSAATLAKIKTPLSVGVDGSGNIFIADDYNGRIRKVNTSGIISTFSDTAISPVALAADASGNVYYFDNGDYFVYKISSSGVRSVFAGNGTSGYNGEGILATSAQMNMVNAIAVDGGGNVYLNDVGNQRVRKVNTSGIIATIAGNGTIGFSGDGAAATAAQLNSPEGVTVDGSGNIFIFDGYNFRIRKVDGAGIISTIAGNGVSGFSGDGSAATAAQIGGGQGLATDASGNVYVCDHDNQRIRKITSSGIISTVAGSGTAGYSGDGGSALLAELNGPITVSLDPTGNLYIADGNNNRIRKVSGLVTEVSGISKQNLDLIVSPNPASGATTVLVNSSKTEPATILINNIAGIKIYERCSQTNTVNQMSFDLPPGCYFITAVTESGTCRKTLVVR